MPFRLRDMELVVKFGDIHPIFNRIDDLRKQWKFMILLALNDWNRANYLMLGFGICAFLLGAISADIVSGGDSYATGMEGLTGVGSFSFFQILLSAVAWVVFLYFVWVEFPVMRALDYHDADLEWYGICQCVFPPEQSKLAYRYRPFRYDVWNINHACSGIFHLLFLESG